MGKISETVGTINSTIRTLLALAVCIVLAAISYIVYERLSAQNRELAEARLVAAETEEKLRDAETQIDALRADVELKQAQIERLETSLHLLKTDQRLARLEVLEQVPDEETGRVITRLTFTELSPDGDAISEPREFEIVGDVIYLDNWVVKFNDEYVEQADLQRGTSLALFRRIFGEYESPSEAALIDEVGAMPQAYRRGGNPSEFEREIWEDFWTFANDRAAAEAKGIRAAHGEALSMKVEAGRRYRVVLRASDGLSIIPEAAATDEP